MEAPADDRWEGQPLRHVRIVPMPSAVGLSRVGASICCFAELRHEVVGPEIDMRKTVRLQCARAPVLRRARLPVLDRSQRP